MAHKSIYLYQKYQIIGDQAPIPVYPEVYSIDADGTMPIVTKMDEDPACGSITPIEPQYRWVVSTGYVCSGTNKMTREIEEISYDSGATWTPTGDERAAYPLIEADSPDCGYVPPTPIYRWVNMDITTDYICDECLVPPTPTFEGKWKATYFNGGSVTSAECDSSSAITANEVNNAGLTSVEIGNCVLSISSMAFWSCHSLTSVTIPNTVRIISDYSFSSCYSLTNITIPSSVTRIGIAAFLDCSGLTSVTIPSGVTDIGERVFESCNSLSSITVNSNNTTYDSRNNCNAIIETSTNTLIQGCKNTVIPNTVTSIGSDAFNFCRNLPSITIPNSVTSIGNQAFFDCYGLTSVTIGNGVTSIGESAFYSCSGLTSITVNATTPPTLLNEYVFNFTNNCPIYVPAGSVSAYKSATNWSNYSSRIQAIP